MYADSVTTATWRRAAARGFTLIELMIVLAIVATLIAIGLPNMADFVAEQRVRSVTSDIASQIAYARAKSVELGRRVYIQRLGADWNSGWRIFADLNNNLTYDAGEELQQFNGFGTGTGSATGRLYVCSTVADFATNVIFRPDGRVVRSGTATTAADGIYVVDPMGDTDPCNNKTRAVLFDLSGRVNSRIITSGSASCKGVTPPC